MAENEWSFVDFASGETPLPSPNLAWNTYGKGLDAIGIDGAPEAVEVPSPAADQLLVRVDAVGLCFSDVKLINQGGDHPKLYGRDLKTEPTRLGHEVSVTVVEVGADLSEVYHEGQRLAIQPDIYVDGRATAYGYTIPGGLIQYHLIGPEVLDADDGAYVIPLSDDIGYAAAALSEPWACVEASYTQRRRLVPAEGGVLWLHGSSAGRGYHSTRGIGTPTTIVLSDVAPEDRALIDANLPDGADVIVRNGIGAADVAALAEEITQGAGFDDIILLSPTDPGLVEEAAKTIAFRGTMTIASTVPLSDKPLIDVGRLHYHYTAFMGTDSLDVSEAWGEDRNRADMVAGGVAVFIGAGGPMGQMHMQRAIEKVDGPSTIIGIDLDDDRLAAAGEMLADLAEEKGRTFILHNPGDDADSVRALVLEHSDGVGADDVVVSVPVGPVMASSADLLGPDGMLVLFAGVPNGTLAPLDMSSVYLSARQYTGTSGSSIDDQVAVLDKAKAGTLSPGRALAAVGGIEAGKEGVRALLEGDYAGKVVIFPQLQGLELTGLDELAATHPEIGDALDNGVWTAEAERLLFEAYHA